MEIHVPGKHSLVPFFHLSLVCHSEDKIIAPRYEYQGIFMSITRRQHQRDDPVVGKSSPYETNLEPSIHISVIRVSPG